jgi:DNA-binding CsgD family transcriptional regulator
MEAKKMPSYVSDTVLDARAYIMRDLGDVRLSASARQMPVIERLRRIVSFEGFAFSGLDIDGCEMGRGVYLATNLPAEFTKTYLDERLIEGDPMVSIVGPDTPIIREDAIEHYDRSGRKTQRLSALMDHYSVAPRTAFTFWNKGRVYGAATFTRQKPFSDDELMTLDMFAPVIHSALAKPVMLAVNQRLGLSKGEVLCLKCAADGLTSEEIASDTRYTVETVNSYFKSATKKLRAANRSQAIAEAIRLKLID